MHCCWDVTTSIKSLRPHAGCHVTCCSSEAHQQLVLCFPKLVYPPKTYLVRDLVVAQSQSVQGILHVFLGFCVLYVVVHRARMYGVLQNVHTDRSPENDCEGNHGMTLILAKQHIKQAEKSTRILHQYHVQ